MKGGLAGADEGPETSTQLGLEVQGQLESLDKAALAAGGHQTLCAIIHDHHSSLVGAASLPPCRALGRSDVCKAEDCKGKQVC